MTTEHWAPSRIWLQREQGDHGSHTWCEDSVGDGDIIEEAEYVRVDASQPQECEICDGAKGGVPGNENIIGGKVVCDYCHAEGSHKVASQPKALTDVMLEKLYWTAIDNAADILKFMDEARALLEATK
jgi:hypothetical protein